MIILDAYAVLALLEGEPAAVLVAGLLDGEDEARLTAVGVAEVIDHLVRLLGASEDDAALDIAQLGLADAVPVDPTPAIRAGMLRARHYHRRHRAVSLADCVAAEATRIHGAALETVDPHLLDLCRHEAIDQIVLPDSPASLWSR